MGEVLALAEQMVAACPKLNIWGVSLEKNPLIEAVAPLRALLGPGLRIVLPSAEQEAMASTITR